MFPPDPTENPVEVADHLHDSLKRAVPMLSEGILTEYPDNRYHLLYPLRKGMPKEITSDFWAYTTDLLRHLGWKLVERKTHRRYVALVITPKDLQRSSPTP